MVPNRAREACLLAPIEETELLCFVELTGDLISSVAEEFGDITNP